MAGTAELDPALICAVVRVCLRLLLLMLYAFHMVRSYTHKNAVF